jgi:UPF0716 protein FxsA
MGQVHLSPFNPERQMPVAIALLAWPLIEIALFVTLGGWLGLWMTMLIILGTAIGGFAVLRWRGMRAVGDLRQRMRHMGNPVPEIVDQTLLVLAGVMLVLPGFLTDFLGLLLLLPPVRMVLAAMAARRVTLRQGPQRSETIDGDFTRIDDSAPRMRGKSGWSQD